MGLKREYINFINSSIDRVFPVASNLKMLELGNQKIKAKSGFSEKLGKEYFSNRGYEHTSVDINGEDGALVKDLRYETDFLEWHNYFDIITNSGTTEHVEPYQSQFECFKILHDVSKSDSVIINLVPDADELQKYSSWKDHCNVYYTSEFFKTLCYVCNYEIIENKIIDGLRSVSYKKTGKSNFAISREIFFQNLNWIE